MALNEIVSAVEFCGSVHDEDTSRCAYAKLLDAVGNNHAGTYGPDAIQLIDLLLPVLEAGSPLAKHTALEALVELNGSFKPEPASLTIDGISLQSRVRQRIAELETIVSSITASEPVAAASAQTLLELMHGGKNHD